MKIVLVLLALSGAIPAQAGLRTVFLYVASNGDDANDCLSPSTPCHTIRAAVDRVPFAASGLIKLAPGHYPEQINSYYSRFSTSLELKKQDHAPMSIRSPLECRARALVFHRRISTSSSPSA